MSLVTPSSISTLAYPFIQHPSANALLDVETSLFKYFLSISDTITERLLLDVVTNDTFIEHAIKTFKAQGYHVHRRQYKTSVQLYGGKTVNLETVYMIPKRKSK
ncbi:hypothetical protein JW960_08890 [candidate division KSB1 bacterium]|nr:hypothetical protein [candidate division KSB1 bacterium]